MRAKSRALAYQGARWAAGVPGAAASGMRALPKTTTVLRTPHSRSASSAFSYSMAKRRERVSSRRRKSGSSIASR